MSLDEWRLVGNNGKGKAYLPNASSETARAVNTGVDARYKSLVEAAMGEGKAVPRFVRNQSMFTGGMPGTAGPRRPLTKTEFDVRFSAGERISDGEIIYAKRTHPLTQSEYKAMVGDRPAQAMPWSAQEPLPTPETARGKIVEGQSIEGNPTGKVREPAIAGAGKTGEGVPAGKGIEAGDDGFREGLIREGGRRAESVSDDFLDGLRGEAGKKGIENYFNKTLELRERFQDEIRILNDSVENAILYDMDGNTLFSKSGQAHSVEFTAVEISQIKGGVLTHNHPTGGSFSPADINMLRLAKLSEIRAVTPDGVHVLLQPKTWNVKLKSYKGIANEYDAVYNRLVNKYLDMIKTGELSAAQANIMIQIETVETLAETFGLDYKFESW